MSRAVRIDAPAKVNLRLVVLSREVSGYHGLETLFCAISLCDRLTLREGEPGIRLRVTGGVDTGAPERNLAVRAADLYYRAIDRTAALEIDLEKRIPSAAGLGGGSSDAAAVLLALNHLHSSPLSSPLSSGALLQLGIELGSDVPFFLSGSPYALAWGRGERLLALPALSSRPVLVAHPGEAMPTAAAFQRLGERREGRWSPQARAFDSSALGGWEGVRGIAENDFEAVAVEELPRLRTGLSALRDGGAEIALLAGSGATIFGVFASEVGRSVAHARLRELGMAVWEARTLDFLPLPRLDPVPVSP